MLRSIAAWAAGRADVVALALVGSWARDAAGEDSDVDLVVLAEALQPLVEDDAWLALAIGRSAEVGPTREWGVLVERRGVLPSGLEVDLGIVPPTWARTEPVDAGTARVVSDGCRALYDPDDVIARLLRTVRWSKKGIGTIEEG